MGTLSDILATVPTESWILFALATGAKAIFGIWPRIRHGFYKARFERMSRQRYVPPELAKYYRLAMGEEPAPLDAGHWLGRALLEGLIAGVPPWLTSIKHDDLGMRLAGIAIGIVLVIATWQWLKEPERKPPWQKAGVPRDAILGFAAALVIVAVMLGLMLEFM